MWGNNVSVSCMSYQVVHCLIRYLCVFLPGLEPRRVKPAHRRPRRASPPGPPAAQPRRHLGSAWAVVLVWRPSQPGPSASQVLPTNLVSLFLKITPCVSLGISLLQVLHWERKKILLFLLGLLSFVLALWFRGGMVPSGLSTPIFLHKYCCFWSVIFLSCHSYWIIIEKESVFLCKRFLL